MADSMRTKHRFFPIVSAAFTGIAALFSTSAQAGEITADGKSSKVEVAVEKPYEAGRGLITLEGPSGMFINPTSTTLPKGAFTWQYCLLFPNTDTEVVAQGSMAAFGVTDWLEIGAVGNYIIVNRDTLAEREFGLGGPIVRIRLLKDESWWPQLSVGAYGKYGTEILQNTTAFLAAYKRCPIDEDGFLKSIGFHAGVRSSWYHKDAPESNSVDGYCGAEIQFPGRFYLVGEIATRGKDSLGNYHRIPYAFGIQWRAGMVNISSAMMQRGNDNELGFWFGVGTALQF